MSDAETQKFATEEPKTTSSPDVPSEEGPRGWLCAVGGFLTMFCTFGFLNAIGVFQTTYQHTTLRTYTPSQISWIFAFQLACMWLPGPLFGRITDAFGPAPVLYPCSFLCVLGLCMTSLSEKYYSIFLSQGVCFGIGAGGVFTCTFVCVGQWFVRRRGLGTGIVTAGSSFGGVIFPIFFNKVMHEVGFEGAVRYTALFIGVLLFISCFLVTSRLPKKEWDWKKPWFDFAVFKEKEFFLYTIGSFLGMWGLWAPFDFISSMATTIGFSDSLALYLISIINASSIFGRLIPGHIADRVGYYNVMTVVTTCTGIAVAALWIPFNYHHSHAGLIVFALIYGFVSGAFVSLLLPCVAKSGKIETLGVRFGTYQPVIGLSTLTGLPIMGAILARQGDVDYLGLQLFSSVSILLGGLFTAASTYFLSKKLGTWKV